jgi:putative oxidoreductase
MRFLEKLKPLGLLVLRVSLGIAFMTHGYPKLISDTVHWVRIFHNFYFPGYLAYVAGVLELFGGGLLVIGLFTRGAALLLAIEMGVVLVHTEIPAAGIYAFGRYELPLILGAASLALATTGAGSISIDAATFEFGRKAPKKTKGKD